jgi:hypothetical protein
MIAHQSAAVQEGKMRWLGAVVAAALTCGCSEGKTTSFGPPEGLRGVDFPDPVNPIAQSDASVDPDAGGACEAGAPMQDANCTVRFSESIYPEMMPGKSLNCTASGCHSEKSGIADPRISDSDPKRAWAQLVQYPLAGKRYVEPCSTDPERSAISCNLGRTGCGSMMPAAGVSAEMLGLVEKWLKCGAPNN